MVCVKKESSGQDAYQLVKISSFWDAVGWTMINTQSSSPSLHSLCGNYILKWLKVELCHHSGGDQEFMTKIMHLENVSKTSKSWWRKSCHLSLYFSAALNLSLFQFIILHIREWSMGVVAFPEVNRIFKVVGKGLFRST